MTGASRTSEALRAALVRELVRRRAIRSDRVEQAFLAVPREVFVPETAAVEGLERVYRDEPIVTKWENGAAASSSSQPALMAAMLEALDVQPGHRVLEVGAGTGYNAALLSTLVGPSGRVVSVDVDVEVARGAERALAESSHRVRVVVGDGMNGFAEDAPYDRIVVTVQPPAFAIAWVEQLAPGGLVQTPLTFARPPGQYAVVTLRRPDAPGDSGDSGDVLESVSVIPGGFMPMRGVSPAAHAAAVGWGEAALFSSEPRASTLDVDDWPALQTALGMLLPDEGVAAASYRGAVGIGFVSPSGDSAAAAVANYQHGIAVVTLLAWGTPDAADHIGDAVSAWRAAGQPGTSALRFRIGLGRDPGPTHWRQMHVSGPAVIRAALSAIS